MDDDAIRDLRRRYWPLVVAACEWRAYGVDAPESMAARVFDHLRSARVADLRSLFRAVDKAVADAYRVQASQRSSLDAIRATMGRDSDSTRPATLVALSALHERDRRILQHAYWDELGRGEIAEVLGTDLVAVQRRLDRATRRLTERLAKRGLPADDLRSVLAEIKPGTHHRGDSSAGA